MIYNASLTLVIKKTDPTIEKISAIAKKYKGYTLSTTLTNVRIRVEAAYFKQAMEDIAKLGEVKKRRISGRDISEQYYDLKVKIDNAEKARKRYLQLLARAEDVKAAVSVEKELERLNRELNRLKGKLQRLRHMSEYSTIEVSLEKKTYYGPLGYVFYGLYEVVKFLFIIEPY